MDKPNILIYDIETSPNLGYCWGKFDQNILKFEEEWQIISVAWKWLGDKKTHVRSLNSYKGDEKRLCQNIWELFDDADIVVAHNGDKFDQKKVRTRLLYHGFEPPSPFAEVDTLKVAKKYFKFNSNRLDDLGEYLEVGRKLKHQGFDLWLGCRANDPKAWAKMEQYNKRDVVLLEKIYKKMRPWITNHPSIAMYMREVGCPNCGSRKATKQGVRCTNKQIMQQFKCKDCKSWFSLPKTLAKLV